VACSGQSTAAAPATKAANRCCGVNRSRILTVRWRVVQNCFMPISYPLFGVSAPLLLPERLAGGRSGVAFHARPGRAQLALVIFGLLPLGVDERARSKTAGAIERARGHLMGGRCPVPLCSRTGRPAIGGGAMQLLESLIALHNDDLAAKLALLTSLWPSRDWSANA
jgi:hypothetical protein